MKARQLLQIFIAFFISIVLFSCRSSRHTHKSSLPPGQAKKVYGHRSAKAFAPGQQKKKAYHYDNGRPSNNNKNKKKHRRD